LTKSVGNALSGATDFHFILSIMLSGALVKFIVSYTYQFCHMKFRQLFPNKRIFSLLLLMAMSGYLMAAEIEGFIFLGFFLLVFLAALWNGFRKREEED
jgi:dolichyl-phosphate-mannose--protein O-mannosyl transferase